MPIFEIMIMMIIKYIIKILNNIFNIIYMYLKQLYIKKPGCLLNPILSIYILKIYYFLIIYLIIKII